MAGKMEKETPVYKVRLTDDVRHAGPDGRMFVRADLLDVSFDPRRGGGRFPRRARFLRLPPRRCRPGSALVEFRLDLLNHRRLTHMTPLDY